MRIMRTCLPHRASVRAIRRGRRAARRLRVRARRRRLCENVRSYDFVGRYGGEEFFIAFPGSNRDSICERAEAIRKAICSEPVCTSTGKIAITLSVGAVVATGEQSVSDVLAIADVGLYKAKDSGRNLSVICGKPAEELFECSLTHRERCGDCEAGRMGLCVISEKVA